MFENRNSHKLMSAVIAGVISGLVLSLLATVTGLFLGERIADFLSRIHPTCERPIGLVPLRKTDFSFSRGIGESAATKTDQEHVVDGYLGSGWFVDGTSNDLQSSAVPVFHGRTSAPSLKLTFATPHVVRLVCVNNGVGNTEAAYRNWGKVRTLKFAINGETASQEVALLSLRPDQMRESQEVTRELGEVQEMEIELIDAYAGETVEFFDPNMCEGLLSDEDMEFIKKHPVDGELQGRLTRGCIRAATPKAGLSEVIVYVEPNNAR